MKTTLRDFPTKPYVHDYQVWEASFEKEVREKLVIAEKNSKQWRKRFKESKTPQKDAWYEDAAEEWDLLAYQLKEILGE